MPRMGANYHGTLGASCTLSEHDLLYDDFVNTVKKRLKRQLMERYLDMHGDTPDYFFGNIRFSWDENSRGPRIIVVRATADVYAINDVQPLVRNIQADIQGYIHDRHDEITSLGRALQGNYQGSDITIPEEAVEENPQQKEQEEEVIDMSAIDRKLPWRESR